MPCKCRQRGDAVLFGCPARCMAPQQPGRPHLPNSLNPLRGQATGRRCAFCSPTRAGGWMSTSLTDSGLTV
eukprot:232626-Chlamydomonas_euryale.AAC.1